MQHVNILGTFIFIIIGYLIGSFSLSIIVSKKKFKKDVREYHSHNAGATNSTRVLGKKGGIIILFADGFKPMIAVLVAGGLTFIHIANAKGTHLFNDAFVYYAGFGSIIGHCGPIYFGFRGGKGAASSLGLLLIINPIYFVVAVAAGGAILYIGKMVSLSSVLMVGVAFAISGIPHMPVNAYVGPHDTQYNMISGIILLTGIVVIMRHGSNLIRIINKTERKVTIFDRKNKKIAEEKQNNKVK